MCAVPGERQTVMLSKPLRKLGFLTIGRFDEANPSAARTASIPTPTASSRTPLA
ncbi:hypothetical protein [Streptomyces sp. NPDC086010]|uniref:hypothetical protein n=1 Tax=Streptomyces sp. NPDC086010 TaxID=3365745 RepID=UPI0037D7B3EE